MESELPRRGDSLKRTVSTITRTSPAAYKSNNHPANIGHKSVSYCTSSHISVITQLNGSVWPVVFPFCLANVCVCAFIWVVDKRYESIDLSIEPSGHRYLAGLVSFLVIARLKIIYGYMVKAREQLNVITQNALDLVECATVLTMNNKSLEALEWRRSIALGSIQLLIVSMDALSYNSELCNPNHWTEEEISKRKEFFRKPTVNALDLKRTILSHRFDYGVRSVDDGLDDAIIEKSSEQLLLTFVENCQNAFYSIDGLINTPFPFPLIQMARTILVFWVYTLPFALQHTPYPLWGICMLVFILTYGFIGIEAVCVEMSDPFGDDANDFDQVNLARITFEDIYLTIFRNDGHDGEVSKVRLKAERLLSTSPFFSR